MILKKYTHISIRSLLNLLFFFSLSSGNAQNRYPSQPDSLLKRLHVKARIADTEDHWAVSIYKKEFFDTNGHIINAWEYSKGFNAIRLQEDYVYNESGQLIKKEAKGIFNPNFQEKSVSTLYTSYQYNENGQLTKEVVCDSTGRVRNEKVYNYDEGKETWYYFDVMDVRIASYQNFFDSNMNIYKSCYIFNGKDSTKNCVALELEFDKIGRIGKQSQLNGKKKEIQVWYSYKANGLLASIKRVGGSFSPSKIDFDYEYWK